MFVTLLVIMDPPGSVPVFLSLTGTYTRKARNRSADLAVLTALTVIVVFALFGQQVLQYLHVTLAAPCKSPADCSCSWSHSSC